MRKQKSAGPRIAALFAYVAALVTAGRAGEHYLYPMLALSVLGVSFWLAGSLIFTLWRALKRLFKPERRTTPPRALRERLEPSLKMPSKPRNTPPPVEDVREIDPPVGDLPPEPFHAFPLDEAPLHQPAPAVEPVGDCWAPAGSSNTVHGYHVSGMLYIGKGLKTPKGWEIEPALIDPSLPVNLNADDYRVRRLDYWPSYDEASPEARASYLNWLSHGKSDPAADIGYVFLYFYGLERRAVFDSLHNEAARPELYTLALEIRRLLDLFGHSAPFTRYAESLLDWIQARQGETSPCPATPPPLSASGALTIEHRRCLGQFALDHNPLPADWALTWLRSDRSRRLKAPASQVPDVFVRAFQHQYTHDHGQGLRLPINKTKLQVKHDPANRSLHGCPGTTLALPDVQMLSAPLNKIQATAETAVAQITAYSRFVKRYPELDESAEALFELPFVLWPASLREPLQQLADTISTVGMPMVTPLTNLRGRLPDWNEITRSRYIGLTQVLAQIGLGIEPDPAFGGKVPKADAKVALFSDHPLTRNSSATSEYSVAALTLHLAVAVSSADGEVAQPEREHLERQLGEWLHLSESQRRRLRAHLRWLITDPPGLPSLKKHVQALPSSAREAIGEFLTQVARADNRITPEEVKLLEKIYRTFELDTKILYEQLQSASDEPVTVLQPTTAPTGYAIPPPPQPDKPAAPTRHSDTLDMKAIAVGRLATEKLSDLLGDIFADEEAEPTAPPGLDTQSTANTEDSLMGLDAVHTALARLLLTRGEWSRDDLEALANERDILLDGALEQINEAAFEAFDLPFCEGEDPVEINPELLEELHA